MGLSVSEKTKVMKVLAEFEDLKRRVETLEKAAGQSTASPKAKEE